MKPSCFKVNCKHIPVSPLGDFCFVLCSKHGVVAGFQHCQGTQMKGDCGKTEQLMRSSDHKKLSKTAGRREISIYQNLKDSSKEAVI